MLTTVFEGILWHRKHKSMPLKLHFCCTELWALIINCRVFCVCVREILRLSKV